MPKTVSIQHPTEERIIKVGPRAAEILERLLANGPTIADEFDMTSGSVNSAYRGLRNAGVPIHRTHIQKGNTCKRNIDLKYRPFTVYYLDGQKGEVVLKCMERLGVKNVKNLLENIQYAIYGNTRKSFNR